MAFAERRNQWPSPTFKSPENVDFAVGASMPFSRYDVESSLMEAMRAAFYRVLRCPPALLRAGRPLTEVVVTKIVELARAGERDPEILCFTVLAQLDMPLQEETHLTESARPTSDVVGTIACDRCSCRAGDGGAGGNIGDGVRHLRSCSGCFRLELSPGGICTRWKSAAVSTAAHPKRSSSSLLLHSALTDWTVQVVGMLPTPGVAATAVPFMNHMDVLPRLSRHSRSLNPSPL
jgi:hypothetical protein